jgi:ribosome-binding factor A
MPSKMRLERIADRINQLLSEMLVTGQISDPRLSGVFITDVKVDRELHFATIFVSSLDGKEREKEILAGFEHASGYIRSTLSKEIQLRSFPSLRFFWDETPERAERIERLIDSLSDQENHAETNNEDE